jgi:glucokinase
MNEQVVAGIDIGGTKIAVALETLAGVKAAARRLPTEVKLGPDRILENVLQTVEEMLAESRTNLEAIGIGCPGPIDIERGLVLSPTNLPDWIDFPLVETVKKRFGVPTILDNDANAAALGEYFYGAGRGFKDVLYITISTGIGGAIICEGKLHHGLSASAGEIGHTIVKPDGLPCRCGNRGCLETIASGLSIARRMRETLAAKNGASVENSDGMTAETVVEMVKNGDEKACRIWDETIKYLAIGIGNAISIIAPEAVIIGGGVAKAGELLLAPLRREIRKNVSMLPIDEVVIQEASLGSESGVCGALMLAHRVLERVHENVY